MTTTSLPYEHPVTTLAFNAIDEPLSITRRARLEHLATEFLRATRSLQLPVPLEAIAQTPPAALWPADAAFHLPGQMGSPTQRMALARHIAHQVANSHWVMRHQLMGCQPMTAEEIEQLAHNLLIPVLLLNTLNEGQRTPQRVAQLFAAPHEAAFARLGEMGYLKQAHFAHPSYDERTNERRRLAQ